MKIRLLALAAILCSLAALSVQPEAAFASLYLPWTVAPKTYCNSGGTVTLNISLPGNANNGSYGVQAGFSVSKDPLNGQNAPNNWIGLNPNYNIDPHNSPFAAVMHVSGLANQPYWPLGGVWNVDVNNSQTASGLGDTWQHVGNFYEVSVPVTVIKFSGANKVAPWKGPGSVTLTADTGPSGICPVAGTATHYRITPQGQAGGSWQTYSAPFPLTDGVWKIDFYSTNTYGTESTHTITYYVDGTPPVESVAFSPFGGYQGWFPASTTFTLTAGDATSGLKSMSYSIDAGPTVTSAGPTQTGSFGPSGNHTLAWKAIDHAGNVTIGSAAVKIDSTPPVGNVALSGTLGANGWYISPVGYVASATDSQSGLASLQVSVDGGAFTNTLSGTVSADGAHSVAWQAADHVFNTSSGTTPFKIDATGPVVTPGVSCTSTNPTWCQSNATVTLNATAVSGITSLDYQLDGGAWTPYSGRVSVTGDAIHSFAWRATSGSGINKTGSLNVQIDSTPPVLSSAQCRPLTAYTQQTITVSATANDNLSGVASWQIDVSNGKTTTTIGSGTSSPLSASFKSGKTGIYTVSLSVTDKADNTTSSAAACSVKVVAPPPPPPPPPGNPAPIPTATDVPTLTPSAVVYGVYQARPTLTYTPSPSTSPTLTLTPTATMTSSPTQSPTPEPSPTPSALPSETPTTTALPTDVPTDVPNTEPTQPSQPAAFVYEDSNGNGRCDAGEPGVGGQKFAVYSAGQLIAYVTSDASGHLAIPTVDGPITLRYLGTRAISGQADYDPQSAREMCVLGLKPEPPAPTLPLLAMAVLTWLWLLPGLLLMRVMGASRAQAIKAFSPFRSKGVTNSWKL